jgi:hypothetical protein
MSRNAVEVTEGKTLGVHNTAHIGPTRKVCVHFTHFVRNSRLISTLKLGIPQLLKKSFNHDQFFARSNKATPTRSRPPIRLTIRL